MKVIDEVIIPSLRQRLKAASYRLEVSEQSIVNQALAEFLDNFEQWKRPPENLFEDCSAEEEVVRACFQLLHFSDSYGSTDTYSRNSSWQLLEAIALGLFHDPKDTVSLGRIKEILGTRLVGVVRWLSSKPRMPPHSQSFVMLAKSGSVNADLVFNELERRVSFFSHYAKIQNKSLE